MPRLKQSRPAPSGPRPIDHLFRHVAFWQSMTFFMLLCAVWGLHYASAIGKLDPESGVMHAVYLSVCIGLVGFITVAHTFVQQHRVLQGLIISCSYCSRVRLDGSQWEELENYLSRRSLAQFSHGICPDCLAEQHPDASELLIAGNAS